MWKNWNEYARGLSIQPQESESAEKKVSIRVGPDGPSIATCLEAHVPVVLQYLHGEYLCGRLPHA